MSVVIPLRGVIDVVPLGARPFVFLGLTKPTGRLARPAFTMPRTARVVLHPSAKSVGQDLASDARRSPLAHRGRRSYPENTRAVVSLDHWYRLPPLPAIYGLDAAGTIEALGPNVSGFASGDRLYVNPILACGARPGCRDRKPILCRGFCLRGYFGAGREGDEQRKV
jgi:hypothetical protein